MGSEAAGGGDGSLAIVEHYIWQVEDEGGWYYLQEDESAELASALSQGHNVHVLHRQWGRGEHWETEIEVDFIAMTETNGTTHMSRKLRRIACLPVSRHSPPPGRELVWFRALGGWKESYVDCNAEWVGSLEKSIGNGMSWMTLNHYWGRGQSKHTAYAIDFQRLTQTNP